jgi:CRISPR-associated protein Cas2
MPMTVVVTRDVAGRVRGFLTSCFLEIAPGVYTAPDLSKGVRERVWTVLEDWMSALGSGSAVMTWPDANAAGGQQVRFLGEPPKDLWRVGEMVLLRRDLSGEVPSGAASSVKSE